MKYKIIPLLAFLHLKTRDTGKCRNWWRTGAETPCKWCSKDRINEYKRFRTIRWNSVKNDFEGYVGDRWLSFTGAGRRVIILNNMPLNPMALWRDFARDTPVWRTHLPCQRKLAISIPKAENGIYKTPGPYAYTLNSSSQPGYRHNLYPPVYSDNSFFGKASI